MVLSARSAYQDTIIIYTTITSIAESVILAATVVMVASVLTAITQNVLTTLISTTMQIAIKQDVLKILSLCVQVVLMVSI